MGKCSMCGLKRPEIVPISMKLLTPRSAALLATNVESVYVAGCTAEPTTVLDVVLDEPDLWNNVHLFGSFVPGVNNLDYTSCGNLQKVSCLFPTAPMRKSSNSGLLHLLPLTYYQWYRYLQSESGVKLAYVQVSPPDPEGRVSLGLTADFIPALLNTSCRLIGIINPNMPYLVGSRLVPLDRFEAFVESDDPLPEINFYEPDEIMSRIAGHVRNLISDGDVLQLGLGKLQTALLQTLGDCNDLGLYGGMISDAVPKLKQQGVLSKGVTTGVALGEKTFYDELSQIDDITFEPVSVTHNLEVTSGMDNFVAINSVLEVDLQGNINAQYLAGQQVTAPGGMPDFIEGARRSRNGRSIVALPSTTSGKNQTSKSRILSRFPAEQSATIAGDAIDYVVTEFGVADLRNTHAGQRQARLVAIAHPDFKDALRDHCS